MRAAVPPPVCFVIGIYITVKNDWAIQVLAIHGGAQFTMESQKVVIRILQINHHFYVCSVVLLIATYFHDRADLIKTSKRGTRRQPAIKTIINMKN